MPGHAGSGFQIKAIGVHDLGPGGDEVGDELPFRIGTAVNFGNGAKLGVRPEDEIDRGSSPLDIAASPIPSFVEMFTHFRDFPLGAHVEQIGEKVVRELAATGRKDTEVRVADIGLENTQPTNKHGHLGSGEPEQLGPVDEILGCGTIELFPEVITEAILGWFQHGEGLGVGHLLGRIGASG